MTTLAIKALAILCRRLVAVCALLFLPGWSLHFPQAGPFLICFFLPQLFIVLDLLKKDPDLLARRLRGGPVAEGRPRQKRIIMLMNLGFVTLLLVSGCDRHLGWSQVPLPATLAADAVMVLGFFVQFLTFRENTYASAVIIMHPNQSVIATGPYALVRHPMYAGAMIVDAAMPIALGSWWGLVVWPVVLATIIVRLLDEEKLLRENLPGYPAYCQKVRARLCPGVW